MHEIQFGFGAQLLRPALYELFAIEGPLRHDQLYFGQLIDLRVRHDVQLLLGQVLRQQRNLDGQIKVI